MILDITFPDGAVKKFENGIIFLSKTNKHFLKLIEFFLNIFDKSEIKFLPIIIGYFSELVLTISLIGLINIYDFFCNLLFCKILTFYFI